MINPAHESAIDPLGIFVSKHTRRQGSRPIPLISTHYDISIDGGFAVVEARRVFRNAEEASIEATLTFPVPVQAVLFSLEAENNGRKLKAKARRREEAREVYEGAVDEGKTAVLHEELLRGIHMLSIAHIAPRTEIVVTTRWATTLTWVGERWQLRIPLTVGQVYGRSPLADSDALEGGGANGTAEVIARRVSGRVSLAGSDLADGRARVPLNRPIDIEVVGAKSSALHGIGADGRSVALQVQPLPIGRDTLDLAILVDRSGSMGEACTGGQNTQNKHGAVINGLMALAGQLRKGDAVDLWEFDGALMHLGSTRDERPHWRVWRHSWKPDAAFEQLVRGLRAPGGGTEIGAALEGVLRKSPARDILLITDGKSYALDIQKLARHGRRIAVVLIGEDSLEANVGHLAAITGGSVFIATKNDIAPVIAAAAAGLRSQPRDLSAIEAQPEKIESVRGGAVVEASWSESGVSHEDARLGTGVAAFAAGLAIALMSENSAAELAEREGLCSHLTSLVLVDEAAQIQDGLPAMRKVALPSPRGKVDAMFAVGANYHNHFSNHADPLLDALVFRRFAAAKYSTPATTPIDWDAAPKQLLDGDLSSLEIARVETLREIAGLPEVLAWADGLKLEPIVLVIAALAYIDRDDSRTAARIARKILGDTPPEWIGEFEMFVSPWL